MRVAYLGPEGTFTQEALVAATEGSRLDLVGLPTVHQTVMAVQDGTAVHALVPLENSLEGSVNATLDTLTGEAPDVRIVGETVHPIRHCLIAAAPLGLEEIEAVVSHPQAQAQCRRFLRASLPDARLLPAGSTAEAVRSVAGAGGPRAALGTRLAAGIYGCRVLRAGVEDAGGNETRFAWLARGETIGQGPPGQEPRTQGVAAWKTSVVFSGRGAQGPGWLVRCLSEFAARDVNLTRIESRPSRQGLGRYMFFADLEGRETDEAVAEALGRLAGLTEHLRVLGSYPAA